MFLIAHYTILYATWYKQTFYKVCTYIIFSNVNTERLVLHSSVHHRHFQSFNGTFVKVKYYTPYPVSAKPELIYSLSFTIL